MQPTTTLWPLEWHTDAKHRILKRYLQAWMPIVAHVRSDELWLIDGFAGPGEYAKGEPGSPIHMLDAFLTHAARPAIEARKQLRFLFIEKDEARARHLEGQVALHRPQLPSGSFAEVIHGDFAAEMPKVNERLERAVTPPPTFLFVDPFGYTDTDPRLSAKLLSFPHCEVLTFMPIEHIARFLNQPTLEGTLTNLFRGPRWRAALQVVGQGARMEALRQSYVEMLHEDAEFVRSFTIRSDSDFSLFFASNNELGLQKMKEAMWTVDRVSGTTYSDSTAPGQAVFFSDAGVSGAIEAILRALPPWSRLDDAERPLLDTPYLLKHLREEVIRLRRAGRIQMIPPSEAMRPGPGTLINYVG